MAFIRKYGVFGRFLKAAKAGIKLEMNHDNSVAKIVFNGYDFGDINRVGFVDPHVVAKRCEAIRMSLWADGFELDEPYNNELGILAVSDLLRDRLLFMAVCHYRMEPEFFDPAHYFHPVESRISLCSVSNTSFQVQQRDISTKTKKLLSVGTIVQVPANKETRRPDAFSHSFKSAMEGRTSGDPIGKFIPETRPSGAHKLNTRFNWSDADYYYHINHSSYIRLGVDAASLAASEGQLPGIEEDLCQYRITECSGLYTREVRPGQDVQVYSWTKDDVPNVIFSEIVREEMPVFHMTLKLDPSLNVD